jgi:hypothetical protein
MRAVRSSLSLLPALLVAGFALEARAVSFTLNLDVHFGDVSGGDVSVTISDQAAGVVRLSMDAGGLLGGADVGAWYFNISDPLVSLASLSATYVSGSITLAGTSVSFGSDAFMADGDGNFDVLFDFPPPGMDRFNAGDIVVYDISGDGDLDALDFFAFSSMGGGQGVYLSAAHILSTGPNEEGSDWVGAVPEPGGALLFGVGSLIAGLAIRRRS